MLKLIADSGSTKTDWSLIDEKGKVLASCQSQGLNPYHLSEENILHTLQDGVLAPLSLQWKDGLSQLAQVFFYGSGVTDAMRPMMANLLSRVFPSAVCEAESDMLGAARGLFGDKKGIAFILGTGSNNCYYDGKKIVEGIPPLGYILGDECSGTAIGKVFLRLILRDFVAEPLKRRYFEYAGVDYATIINKVYREPLANRYLASIAPFVGKILQEFQVLDDKARKDGFDGISDEELEYYDACDVLYEQIAEMFMNFLSDVLLLYKGVLERHGERVDETLEIPVGFVGSIAEHFKEFFADDIEKPYYLHKILQSPMEGLIAYHA